MKLENKHILITGGNRGIGRAIAEKAARLKMNIHLLCRSADQELEKDLLEFGAESVKTWPLDLSDSKNIDQFVEQFKSAGGICDILVNNAGQLTGGLLEEQDPQKIYSMIQVNLTAMMHLTRLMLPDMLKRPEAKIVNNASVSGMMYLPCASTYAASKAGVIAFTESLKNELKDTSVTTLCMITPGVKTRMFDEIPDLYSGHIDLKFVNSISAEEWIDRVFDHMKSDKATCWPKGQSLLGVKIGQHFPNLLGKIADPYFKR